MPRLTTRPWRSGRGPGTPDSGRGWVSRSSFCRRARRPLCGSHQPPAFAAGGDRRYPSQHPHRPVCRCSSGEHRRWRNFLQSISTAICVIRNPLNLAKRGFDDSFSPSAKTPSGNTLSTRGTGSLKPRSGISRGLLFRLRPEQAQNPLSDPGFLQSCSLGPFGTRSSCLLYQAA